MSCETDPHSIVVSELLRLLGNIFEDIQFATHNSNRPVYIEDCKVVFNPDVSVVQGPSKLFTYQPGMNAVMNPVLLVEVLSPSTRNRDFGEKLPCYKQIPGLRQIIYIELDYPMVYLFERDGSSEKWTKTILDEIEDTIHVNGQVLNLKAMYCKSTFS